MAENPLQGVWYKKPNPNQMKKDTVVYMYRDQGPFRCDNCEYWRGPKSCEIVAGWIDPGGCCNVYEKRD